MTKMAVFFCFLVSSVSHPASHSCSSVHGNTMTAQQYSCALDGFIIAPVRESDILLAYLVIESSNVDHLVHASSSHFSAWCANHGCRDVKSATVIQLECQNPNSVIAAVTHRAGQLPMVYQLSPNTTVQLTCLVGSGNNLAGRWQSPSGTVVGPETQIVCRKCLWLQREHSCLSPTRTWPSPVVVIHKRKHALIFRLSKNTIQVHYTSSLVEITSIVNNSRRFTSVYQLTHYWPCSWPGQPSSLAPGQFMDRSTI